MSMTKATLTVTAKGQVTMRRAVLAHLGVEPGDTLVVELLPGGRAEVRAARSGTIDDLIGCIPYDGPPVSLEEIQDAIEAGWAGEI